MKRIVSSSLINKAEEKKMQTSNEFVKIFVLMSWCIVLEKQFGSLIFFMKLLLDEKNKK